MAHQRVHGGERAIVDGKRVCFERGDDKPADRRSVNRRQRQVEIGSERVDDQFRVSAVTRPENAHLTVFSGVTTPSLSPAPR